jgi:hypothetical protein
MQKDLSYLTSADRTLYRLILKNIMHFNAFDRMYTQLNLSNAERSVILN